MTTRKRTPKAKRPPRQVWIGQWDDGDLSRPFLRKKDAGDEVPGEPGKPPRYRVVGPYVLAERVRER